MSRAARLLPPAAVALLLAAGHAMAQPVAFEAGYNHADAGFVWGVEIKSFR